MPNQAGIDFYRNMSEECRNLGMKVMITISHYETPLAMRDKYGSWANRIYIDTIQNGVDLFGYTMWRPIDIVSNGIGQMSKRYGIIYVDLDDDGNGTGKRLKKKPYEFYRRVIESNGSHL